MAGSLFPLKANDGKGYTIDSGACDDTHPNCSRWRIVSNNDGNLGNFSQVDVLPTSVTGRTGFVNGISHLENFNGALWEFISVGTTTQAPRLNFSSDTETTKLIQDSVLNADMFGSFYKIDIINSTINGFITTYNNGVDRAHQHDIFTFKGSTLNGDINNVSSASGSVLELHFTDSTIRGNILVNSTAPYNTSVNSQYSAVMYTSIENSTWYGSFKDITADSHFENHLSIKNSQVNPDSDKVTNFNFINGHHDFAIDGSTLNADIYTQTNLNTNMTNNSSIHSFYQMGGGGNGQNNNKANQLGVTDSKLENIKITAGFLDINLNRSTLGLSIDEMNKKYGGLSIFVSGGWGTLTATDSTINGAIDLDAYNSLKITATNTTLNGSDGYAILDYFGSVYDSSFDHSTVNGSFLYTNSEFSSSDDLKEGLVFKNGSVWNGNLQYSDSPYGVNKNGAHFSFKDSTMNGNIIATTSHQTNSGAKATDPKVNVTQRLMFRQSHLNGDVAIESKNLNSTSPSYVDTGLGFWQSTFNFKNITIRSDDVVSVARRPKLYLSLNETTMNGQDINNQGDLDIRAGRSSTIKANITTGFGDLNETMNNTTFTLILDDKDRTIQDGMTQKNTDGTDKVTNADDPNRPSYYEGRLITQNVSGKNNITLNYGHMNLLSGSDVYAKLNAATGDNSLSMRDSAVHLQSGSGFGGSLGGTGYNRLYLDDGISLNLSKASSYQGSLISNGGSNTINISAKTALYLKPNANASDMTNYQKPPTTLGFSGHIYDTTSGGNYLELDSTAQVDNGQGGKDNMVAIVLKDGTSDNPNKFTGTLFTKGTNNYINLASHTSFTLDAESYFDGILVTDNYIDFDNRNGNVVLEKGSDFTGGLSANTLILKGATVKNSSDTIIRGIQVLEGENEVHLSENTTAPITNNGGTLWLNFNPDNSLKKNPAISFKGSIYNYGGTNNIDFIKTLYADATPSTILASGEGVNNISYNSDMATIQVFATTLATIPNQTPIYNIYTQDNAQNNFAISGPFSAKANIYYSGGNTTLILADNVTGSMDLKTGNTPENLAGGSINGYTFNDGVSIKLSSKEADRLLKPYRDIYSSNFASLSIDKLSSTVQLAQAAACKADNTKCLTDDDPKKITGFLTKDGKPIYKAYLDGILVGDITSLTPSADAGKAGNKEYLAVLNPDSAFIGNVEIKDTPISISLSQGAKVIFTESSTLETLQSSSAGIDESSFLLASLSQKNNTIIDLATLANADNIVRKDEYSTLNVKNLQDVQNVIFKFAFGTDADGNAASDKLVVAQTSGSKNNVIEIYQNLSHPTTLKDGERLLVASIFTGGTPINGKIFSSGDVINHEGFDIITSNIIALDQDSNDPTKAHDGTVYTNYYLTSLSSAINPKAANLSKAALNSNRSILLGNINDLNKRLGELRDNPYAQGAWARVFNGMTSSNYGLSMTNNFTNVQAGYDYSVGDLQNANQYLGFAVSYGYNALNASGADLKGNGNMIELGVYYSYVGDSGIYSDSILKYAFINNKLTMGESSLVDYNSSALTFGQEVGYRFFLDKNKRFYIDPLAELTLGYFGGGDVNQTKGEAFLNSKFDASFIYRIKVGGNMGYRLITSKNETDFRAGLSYVLDGVSGDISMNSNLSSGKSSIPVSNTGLVQLGVNSVISSNWRAYLDLDVGFGSQVFRQDYLISVGGRYLFGKKARQAPITNTQTSKNKLKK